MAKKQNDAHTATRGPHRGDLIPPPALDPEAEERRDALPKEEEFWKPPARFGSVPVESEPLAHRSFNTDFHLFISRPYAPADTVLSVCKYMQITGASPDRLLDLLFKQPGTDPVAVYISFDCYFFHSIPLFVIGYKLIE